MQRHSVLFGVSLALLALPACLPERDEGCKNFEVVNAEFEFFNFYLQDSASGENLISVGDYPPEDIRFSDDSGSFYDLDFTETDQGWRAGPVSYVSWNIEAHQPGSPVEKNFFLHLNTNQDTDTITVRYQTKFEDCFGEEVVEDLSLYFNGKKVRDSRPDAYIFNKKP